MMDHWLTNAVAIGAGLVAIALTVTWLPALLIKQRQSAWLRSRCKGKLALTYDDGPGPLLTPSLIELLARYNAKATFFLVGFRALRFPDVCDRLVQTGHELGCHTHWHRKPWRTLPWLVGGDVTEGYRSMKKWIRADAPFRPPFGKLTTWSWLAVRSRGALLSWWTFDGQDTHPQLPDPTQVAQEAVATGGAVVLLHSHDRGEDRRQYVLELTEQLLIAARRKGLEVCTMSRVMEPGLNAQENAAYGSQLH
jgi:peptidoglycan/xylan/chitin deacetylase (PgdA/CDA1 family)